MNQKGFTLVEVLVATLLGALVVGGLGTLLLNAFKIAGKIESKTEFNSLVQSLELVLKDESLCASSLKNGKKFPESTVAKFDPDKKLDADELLASIQLKETVIAKLGQVFPYFSVSKLYFNEVDSSKREVLSPTETKYLVQLRLEATKANSLLNSSMKHDFLMWVTTKASVVESCMMKAEAPKVMPSVGIGEVRRSVVTLTSNVTVPWATNFKIPWHVARVNLGGFWISTQPTRLTIPVGSGIKQVRVGAGTYFLPAGAGREQYLGISKNGGSGSALGLPHQSVSPDVSNHYSLSVLSPILDVVEGDYFEVSFYTSRSPSTVLNPIDPPGSDLVWFSIEEIPK